MGVYIRNMKMPNSCYREIRIYPDGRVIEEDECGIDEIVGMAEQVQSHGKLIDADAVIKKIPIVSYEIYENIRTLLEGAPTIISASEDET